MADEQTTQGVPAPPPRGAIVTEQALYLTQISLYRNTMAFGGTRNPTAIWQAMTYNEPHTMSYFRELEEKDEDVGNALDALKLSCMERKRNIAPANEKDSSAVDVRDFIDAQLKAIDMETVLDCILDAPGYGFSVQEITFDVSMGQVQLAAIDDCPQELFLFGNRFRTQTGKLQYLDNPFASEGMEVPEQKFVITSYRKRARNRMGRPLLKSLFWPSWFKRNVQRMWLQYAEKGPGTALVRYNDANNPDERERAAEIAQAIIENVAIAVPVGLSVELELLKSARSLDPSVHEHLYRLMQLSITRRVLGETLSTFGGEEGKGTQALGEVHADTFQKRSVSLAKFAASIINQQIVRPLVLWNYGPDAPVPTWSFDLEEEEDLAKRIVVDTGLQKMGKRFTAGYVSDRYGVPLAPAQPGADGEEGAEAENPDDVLKPAQAPAPAPAAAQGQQDDPDEDAPDFTERGSQQQAHQEMKEFDDVFADLRKGAAGIFRQRVGELAAAVVPVERR